MTRLLQFFVVIAILTGAVAAQTDTTFTYQGELKESGEPANGSYNMDFSLWDAPSGGSQVGSTIEFDDQPVTDGLFTVELDFGADVFDATQLWLEVSVNGTELDPRQPLTGAPYAIQTRGIVVDADHHVGIGTTTPVWELEVANLTEGEGAEAGVTANDAGGAVAAYSSTLPPPFEHFAGRVSLFADSFATGLDLRADGSTGDIRFYTGGWPASNERMRITEAGHVGIGTSAPGYPLTIDASDDDHGVFVTTTGWTAIHAECSRPYGIGIWGYCYADNSEGVYGSTLGEGGYGVHGEATGGEDSKGVYGQSVHGCGVFGLGSASYATNYGVYGKSNSPSGYDFYAGGAGQDYGSSSSIRWKRNIELIDDPLDKVARLRGVYFDWDEEHGGQHDVGMIAEEVGLVLPEIVNYEENGIDASGMDYSKLTPLLVEAVNALRAEKDAEIAQRDRRIESLEHANAELEARLARLETLVNELASRQEVQR